MKFYKTYYSKVKPTSGAFLIEVPGGNTYFGYTENLKQAFNCFCLGLLNDKYEYGWSWVRDNMPAVEKLVDKEYTKSKVIFSKINYSVFYGNLTAIRREISDKNLLKTEGYKIVACRPDPALFIYKK